MKELNISLDKENFDKVFHDLKNLADKKKTVTDRDIEALIMDISACVPETWKLDSWAVSTGSALETAAVCATGEICLVNKNGEQKKYSAAGDGPLDSIFKAINKIIGRQPELELYELGAVTGGSSSQGETIIKIALDSHGRRRRWNGRGVSTDVIESSIKAYISAINAMEYELADKTGNEL